VQPTHRWCSAASLSLPQLTSLSAAMLIRSSTVVQRSTFNVQRSTFNVSTSTSFIGKRHANDSTSRPPRAGFRTASITSFSIDRCRRDVSCIIHYAGRLAVRATISVPTLCQTSDLIWEQNVGTLNFPRSNEPPRLAVPQFHPAIPRILTRVLICRFSHIRYINASQMYRFLDNLLAQSWARL
jgi:hypothetical protein